MRILLCFFTTLILSGCCCVCWWPTSNSTNLSKMQELCQSEVSKKLNLSSGRFGFATPQIIENNKNSKKYILESYVEGASKNKSGNVTYYRCFVEYNTKSKQARVYDLKLYQEKH